MLPHLRNQHDREDGFTLVELLIVVLIVGILAAIAVPVYLGLQNQAKNNTVKQDTNSTVHRIQVALTEGQTITAALTAHTDTTGTYRSDGTNVTSTIASDNKNYTVVGTQKDTQFTYTYDSTTGKFTEGTADINLGGGSTPTPSFSYNSNNFAGFTAVTPAAIDSRTPYLQYSVTSATGQTGYAYDTVTNLDTTKVYTLTGSFVAYDTTDRCLTARIGYSANNASAPTNSGSTNPPYTGSNTAFITFTPTASTMRIWVGGSPRSGYFMRCQLNSLTLVQN